MVPQSQVDDMKRGAERALIATVAVHLFTDTSRELTMADAVSRALALVMEVDRQFPPPS